METQTETQQIKKDSQKEINKNLVLQNLNNTKYIIYKKEKDTLRCLNCNTEIQTQTEYKGLFFNRKKIITFFCPLCEFKKVIEFNINNRQYKKEIL